MNKSKSSSKRNPPDPPADIAARISDPMYAAMLSGLDLDLTPAHLSDVRDTFVAFCLAHPKYTDVRPAWLEFKRQLETEINNLQTSA